MTPEERAEKIFRELPGYPASPCTRKEVSEWEELSKAFLATHIAEAQREAVNSIGQEVRFMQMGEKSYYREGFAAAKAKAAGVVREKYFQAASEDSCAEEWLAAQIEALEP